MDNRKSQDTQHLRLPSLCFQMSHNNNSNVFIFFEQKSVKDVNENLIYLCHIFIYVCIYTYIHMYIKKPKQSFTKRLF